MEEIINVKKVSVVIPAYNAENTIVRCLNSVLAQTYPVFEIIVINDGSTDRTKEIIEEYIQNHSGFNIKLINKANGGVSSARNVGLKLASGEYIALLDSDDEWLKQKTEVQIEYFEKDVKIDFLAAGFQGFHLKNKSQNELFQITFEKLLFKNFFQPSTVIFKNKIISNVGFFEESQKYAEEGNYFLRVSRLYNCFFLNQKLINYGDGKSGYGVSGLSSNLFEMEKGELSNLKFAYDKDWINFFKYSIAVLYSIAKYFRRIVIVKFR